jgi:hypothetical protein
MGLFDITWSLQVEKLLPPVVRDMEFVAINDDFKTGTADNNYAEYIIASSPGHWKEFPTIGVGIYNYIQGTQSPQVLQRNIASGLRADSNIFTNPSVDVRNFPTIIVNKVIVVNVDNSID